MTAHQQRPLVLVFALVVAIAGSSAELEAEPRRRWWAFPERACAEWRMPDLPSMPTLRMPTLRMPALPAKFHLRALRRGASNRDGLDDPDALVGDFVSSDDAWSLRVERDGVRVWRRKAEGSAYDEVRGNGIIRVPPEDVIALLRQGDAETIRTYNPMYDSGHDLEQLDQYTKVSYGSVRAIFPFKPRDTVTRVAERELPTVGGTALILHAVDHPAMPPRSDFVRAKILRGMHLVQPVANQPGVTNFTFTQQVNAGGIIPAWLMNTLIAQDAVTFVRRLGEAASKR